MGIVIGIGIEGAALPGSGASAGAAALFSGPRTPEALAGTVGARGLVGTVVAAEATDPGEAPGTAGMDCAAGGAPVPIIPLINSIIPLAGEAIGGVTPGGGDTGGCPPGG